jgi:chromosome segregation ATPase
LSEKIAELESSVAKVTAVQSHVDLLSAECDRLKQALHQKESELLELSSSSDDSAILKAQLSEQTSLLRELDETLRLEKAAAADAAVQAHNATRRLEEANNVIADLKHQLDATKGDSDRDGAELKLSLKNLKQELSEASALHEAQLTTLTKQLTESKTQIEELKRHFAEQQTAHNSAQRSLSSQLNDALTQRDSLSTQIEEMKSLQGRSSAEAVQVEGSSSSTEATLHAQIEELKSSFQGTLEMLKQNQMTFAEEKWRRQKLEQENSLLTQRIAQLESAASSAATAPSTSLRSSTEVDSESTRLLASEIKTMKEQFGTALSAVKTLKSRNEQLEARAQQLDTDLQQTRALLTSEKQKLSLLRAEYKKMVGAAKSDQ